MNKLLVDGIYATNIVKLKDIAEKKTTKNIDGLVTETFTNSAENGIISQSDFFDRTITNEKNISGYFIVEPDDFVYNPRISTFAPVGPINRNKLGRSGVMSPLYLVFHTHDVEPEYLEWYFKSNAWHQFMRDNGNTGARSDRFSISDAEFFNMPIPIPPVKVQKAIAKTLTTLDTKVTLEKNEVEKFKNLKSAILTKMFSKEGENVPEIRFPCFTGAWEQHKFNDVSEKLCVGFVGTCEKHYTDKAHGIPMYRTGNIKDGFLVEDDMKFVTRDFHEKNKKSQLKKNDILIARFGENGLGAQYLKDEEANCLNCIILHPNAQADVEYVKQYLSSDAFRKKAFANTVGSTFSILNTTTLGRMDIPFTSLTEQNAIAEFLSKIDTLITLHQRKYEKLVDTKKAFLEKLIGGEK